jgi:cyclomaltodextrinase / maltogenic alpha-amylase / neopullulanase
MSQQVPGWVRDAVFYQVFPDRFARSTRLVPPGPLEPWGAPPTPHGFQGGDLYGLAERLPELADLGITAIYLNPVFASASNHRYHTYDYLSVDPLLGGDAALRELLDAAHGRGMRVILDGVFNHVGRGFWAFHHVMEAGADSPYRDWFHLSPAVLAGLRGLRAFPDATPSWAEVAADPGPYTSGDWSLDHLGYRAWWGLPALPKLNTSNPRVREMLLGVAERWIRFGADGWRLDVPAEIDDPGFWQEFRRRCRAANPEAYLVGEIWHVAPEWLAGDRFDGLMNYPLLEAILSFVGGPSLDRELVAAHHELGQHVHPADGAAFGARVAELLAGYDPATNAAMLNLLSSHDMPRIRSLLSGDMAALRLAVLLQMSLPGAPSIYYGDEIGMEGGNDPDCRRAFPAGQAGRDEALRAFHRTVVTLRREHPGLRADRVALAGSTGPAVALVRGGDDDATAGGETLLVAVNAGTAAVDLRIVAPALAGRSLVRVMAAGAIEAAGLPGTPLVTVGGDGGATVPLGPQTGMVLLAR